MMKLFESFSIRVPEQTELSSFQSRRMRQGSSLLSLMCLKSFSSATSSLPRNEPSLFRSEFLSTENEISTVQFSRWLNILRILIRPQVEH